MVKKASKPVSKKKAKTTATTKKLRVQEQFVQAAPIVSQSPKLTFAEYEKVVASGILGVNACACIGPQNGDPLCPCSMNVINCLDPQAQQQYFARMKAAEQQVPRAPRQQQMAAQPNNTGRPRPPVEFVYED